MPSLVFFSEDHLRHHEDSKWPAADKMAQCHWSCALPRSTENRPRHLQDSKRPDPLSTKWLIFNEALHFRLVFLPKCQFRKSFPSFSKFETTRCGKVNRQSGSFSLKLHTSEKYRKSSETCTRLETTRPTVDKMTHFQGSRALPRRPENRPSHLQDSKRLNINQWFMFNEAVYFREV